MKKLLASLLVIGATYLAGYWPERLKRVAAEGSFHEQQTRLAEAQARVRAGELLGRILNLEDAVVARNYGLAQEQSTSFFDALGTEAARSQPAPVSAALQATLTMRDVVTAALVRADPAALELVRGAESRLREGLGYAPPPSATPTATPTPSP